VGYGGSSKSAHALIEEHFRDFALDDVKHAINKIPVICFNIFLRAFEIANIDCPKNFKKLLEDAKSGEVATKEIESITQRSLDIGDLVTTDGSDVAEILEVNTSQYAYKNYHVRYLINPKIKEISEEWLPPRYVGACLLKKQKVRDLFTHRVAPLIGDKSVDWINKQTDETLYGYSKTTILNMARDGHLKILFETKPKTKNRK